MKRYILGKLTGVQLRMYLFVCRAVTKKNDMWNSFNDIADALQIARKKVIAVINELVGLGFIRKLRVLKKDGSFSDNHYSVYDMLKSGDTLVIGSLFCLGEKSDDIIRNIEFFINSDIRLKVLDVPVTLSEGSDGNMRLIGTVMIQMLSLFDKKEPKPQKKRDYPENWVDVYTRYFIKHEITARQARELTGLSQYLLTKYIKEYTAEYTDCPVKDAK